LSIRYNIFRAYATNVFTKVSALFLSLLHTLCSCHCYTYFVPVIVTHTLRLSLLHTLCSIYKIRCHYDSRADGTYRLPTRKMYGRPGKQKWYYLEIYLKSHNIISLESVKLALSSTHSITVLKYTINPMFTVKLHEMLPRCWI